MDVKDYGRILRVWPLLKFASAVCLNCIVVMAFYWIEI